METNNVKKRNEIEGQYKWAICDLFPSDEAWKSELEHAKEMIQSIKEYKGKLSQSADILYEFYELTEELYLSIERVYGYAHRKYHEDTSLSIYQGFSDQASSLVVQMDSALSFMNPEIVAIPEETLNSFMKENEKLKKYGFAISIILRQKDHRLSAELEDLIANAGEMFDAPKTIFSMFNNADIKFPEIEDELGNMVRITHSRYVKFLESSDRRIRKDNFKNLYDTYKMYDNTLAAMFIANIKQEAFQAKARNYGSSLERALDNSNIPSEVYTNLIDTVHENLPKMHRYVQLRKKALGLDELHMYDLITPMIADVNRNIEFEEAKEMVIKGLVPLGEEYCKIVKEGYDNGWIDVYENEGKRSGAYSWGAYGIHPYVLLNYQNNLSNVFTLAHEMGHAMHSYYSDATQPVTYAGYKIFVAEVASTCNEALLMEYLLKTTEDKKQRAYLINYFLEQFRSIVFRQTMFAEFEMITHQKNKDGEALTAETICKIYHELNVKYYGDDIVVDDEIAMEWARVPHFYNSFYVYQYATGYSAAMALSKKILDEGEPAVKDYINKFLCGGGSDYPIELLKKAGVDMSTKEPINQALLLFESLLDEMEKLLEEA